MQESFKTPCKAEFSSEDGFQEVYNLDKLRISIGAHTDADIVFPGLSFEHAELLFENGNWIIRKRNPNAIIRFRGYPVELKKLNPGDRLFLGAGVLTFIGDGDREITAITTIAELTQSKDTFHLTVINGREKNRKISLQPGEYILGRMENKNAQPNNSRRIEFDHRFVSREHARIFVDRFRLRLQDLHSTNGTRINGKLVETGEIKPGYTLTLGKLRLLISGPQNPAGNAIPTVAVRLRDTTWSRIIWIYLLPGTILLAAIVLLLIQ